MGKRNTIDYQGRKVEGEVLEFQSKGEAWNQYELEDGTTLRVKIVMLDVVRLIDEYDDNGEPVYVLSAQQIVATSAPSHLRKQV